MTELTQPQEHLDVEALLERARLSLRAAVRPYTPDLPQFTPEEKAQRAQEFLGRLNSKIQEDLDTNNTLACSLCHWERPRTDEDRPDPDDYRTYYYPSSECERVREPWHYHRTFRRKQDKRERRRHVRRVRRGRVHRTIT